MEEDEEYYDDFEEERPSGESSRGQSLHYITPIRHRTNKKSKSKNKTKEMALNTFKCRTKSSRRKTEKERRYQE